MTSTPTHSQLARTPRRVTRKGAATVELAVCLPILAILVFGSLSATSMIFLRQAVVQSAYECVKTAVKREGTVDSARQRAQEVLTFRDITPNTIEFQPANVESQPGGTPITVTIRADADPNRFFSFGVFKGQSVEVQATMLKE